MFRSVKKEVYRRRRRRQLSALVPASGIIREEEEKGAFQLFVRTDGPRLDLYRSGSYSQSGPFPILTVKLELGVLNLKIWYNIELHRVQIRWI